MTAPTDDIVPFFWPSEFESPIVLYEGPAKVRRGTATTDGVGQVVFRWRPSPKVTWILASSACLHSWLGGHSDGDKFDVTIDMDSLKPATELVAWRREGLQDGYTSIIEGKQPDSAIWGADTNFSFVVVHIVNFVDQVDPHVPAVDTVAAGWRIRVVRCDGTEEARRRP